MSVIVSSSMKEVVTVNETERKVLEVLAEGYDSWGETGYWSFDPLSKKTGLDIKQVRRACRSLARKGLAEFMRGLWSDDGPAGAGYGSTRTGASLITPCDVCGDLAMYEYKIDKNGESYFGLDTEGIILIRECEEHYKKSHNHSRLPI